MPSLCDVLINFEPFVIALAVAYSDVANPWAMRSKSSSAIRLAQLAHPPSQLPLHGLLPGIRCFFGLWKRRAKALANPQI